MVRVPSVPGQNFAMPSSLLALQRSNSDPGTQTLSRSFSAFVAEKLLSDDQKSVAFTGRDWVFAELLKRVTQENVQVLVVRGSAGLGKSSIIAHIVSCVGEEHQRKLGLKLSSFPASSTA